ncbi:hypothetical protein AB0I77_23100, partial [Streptomyces sp. NPDC050619]
MESVDAHAEARCITADDNHSVQVYHWTDDPRVLLYEQDGDGDENRLVYRVDLDNPDAEAVDLTPFPDARAVGIETSPSRPGKALLHQKVATSGRDRADSRSAGRPADGIHAVRGRPRPRHRVSARGLVTLVRRARSERLTAGAGAPQSRMAFALLPPAEAMRLSETSMTLLRRLLFGIIAGLPGGAVVAVVTNPSWIPWAAHTVVLGAVLGLLFGEHRQSNGSA